MNIEKYLEGVWTEGGRDWPNVDCYGIVLKVRKDLGLPDWPEWGHAKRSDGTMHQSGMEFKNHLRKCDPEVGAIIGCYSGSFLTHVAVVVDDHGILSALEITGRSGVNCRPISRLNRIFTKVEFYNDN